MKYQVICFIGPDGTGKTTQAELLKDELVNRGYLCEYRWLRFHHFFSLPLLALARILNFSELKSLDDGTIIGYHFFYKSKMISFFYQWLLLLDTTIYYFFYLNLPLKLTKKIFICDRCIYDTLIDLEISTHKKIFDSFIGYLFLKLLPENLIVILFNSNISELKQRRLNINLDLTIGKKIELYNIYGNKLKIKTINANQPQSLIKEEILCILQII